MMVPFLALLMRCALLLWLLVLVPAAAAAPRTLLVVGDSLSAAYGMDVEAGWVALLRARLRAARLDYTIVNASISGETTANGRARMPRLLAEHRPAAVVIALGGNDGLRGQSPAQMKRNFEAMVADARRAGARVLLVGVELPPNYGQKYLERFRAVFRDVARARKVPLVPFLLAGVADDPRLMQPDGIHPTAAAQARMLENVWPQLRPLL